MISSHHPLRRRGTPFRIAHLSTCFIRKTGQLERRFGHALAFSRLEPTPRFAKVRPTRSASQEIAADHQLGPRMAALGSFTEPVLCQIRIWSDMMSAMVKCAKREHCTRMAFASCLAE